MTRLASLWLPSLAIDRWRRATTPSTLTPTAAAPDRAAANLGGAELPAELATVLVVEAAHGPVIHAANAAALAGGARPGGRLTDARALDPALVAIPADVSGDSAWLARLARWATRWSPLVEVDGSDALRLDISGVAHLFGGERALLADIATRLGAMGMASRLAIAPTAAAAWGLSHFGREAVTIVPAPLPSPPGRGRDPTAGWEGEARQQSSSPFRRFAPPSLSRRERENENLTAALAPLPVAALRLDPQATHTLVRLGLKTIGDLAGVPRKGLARRFRASDHPLDALDRALGRKPEPLTATRDDPPPRATLRLAEPVADPAAGPQALGLLIPPLVAQLEHRHLGVRKLEILGYRVDGSVVAQGVATAIPSRDPAHLARLLADKAAALDPGFGFDGFALVALWTEPLGAAQDSLVADPSPARDVARLVDRLTVKLGAAKVRRPAPHATHWPERAVEWVAGVDSGPSAFSSPLPPAGGAGGGQSPPGLRTAHPPAPSRRREGEQEAPRPPRMLDRPEAIGVIYATPEGLPRRFTWRRGVHDITRAQGPERIAPEWWRERSTARLRDYYRVEDRDGRRFWIFREGIAGDGRGGPPEWYLHGLFG